MVPLQRHQVVEGGDDAVQGPVVGMYVLVTVTIPPCSAGPVVSTIGSRRLESLPGRHRKHAARSLP